MCKVTVGLCVKSVDKNIKGTLDSILNQDFPHENMEIIVVEGGNEDRSIDLMINGISKAGMRAKVYCDGGKGLGAARQMVVDTARGNYIVWVDGDVVLPRNFVRKQLNFISENPDVGLATGQSVHVELERKAVTNILSLYMSMLRVIHLGATICRAQAMREVNGFDQRIKGAGEDMDIACRMVMAHWRLATNSKANFFHKQRATLRGLLNKGIWYGFGGHFMSHKYEDSIKTPYRLPPIYFGLGLKLSSKAYREYGKKKSFLIPIASSFFSIGWCLGFIKGHISGYGHSIKNHEIKKERTLITIKTVEEMLTTGEH